MPNNCPILPARGRLVVNTDLHGNLEDFRAVRDVFLRLRAERPDTLWAILGDIVHGPDDKARLREPELYDYPDESWEIAEEIIALKERFPGNVLYVLGNHDYAHLGGPKTRKFHDDEAAFLESRLSAEQIAAMRKLFAEAHLGLACPCGAFLAHGSPDAEFASLEEFEAVRFPPPEGDARSAGVLASFLNSYGQTAEAANRFLKSMSRLTGIGLRFVIHGHDRDEDGYFFEGGNQLCPVIFGAPRRNKRFVLLDLAERYASAMDLKPGREILPLYPARRSGEGGGPPAGPSASGR
jgi:hypothetical protein